MLENLNSGQNLRKSRYRSNFLEFSIYFQTILILAKISKSSNFVKLYHKLSRFVSKFSKMFILVKIFGKYLFPSKYFANLGIGQNSRKILILAKTFQNLDFCQKFRKLCQIFVKIFDDFR